VLSYDITNFFCIQIYLGGDGRERGRGGGRGVHLSLGKVGRSGGMVAGASSARAAGHRAGTGCETVYGRFYFSGFIVS